MLRTARSLRRLASRAVQDVEPNYKHEVVSQYEMARMVASLVWRRVQARSPIRRNNQGAEYEKKKSVHESLRRDDEYAKEEGRRGGERTLGDR